MRTIADIIAQLPSPSVPRLAVPPYSRQSQEKCVGLAVASMRNHMTDEGYQIFAGLAHAGYQLAGRHLPIDEVHVPRILHQTKPNVVFVQDPREFDVKPRDFRDSQAKFYGTEILAERLDIFKTVIVKDAHQEPLYHSSWASRLGVHAFVVYYHPRIVAHLAPYVRPEHLVRTYHTVDRQKVPPYRADGRQGALLSGAVSNVYPWRQRLVRDAHLLPGVSVLRHPGYHRQGCATPAYLETLSRFKVAICTSSIYGYALRKIIEATACGCRVVTDLPVDEVLPEIDGNLIRLPPTIDTATLGQVLRYEYGRYDPEQQRYYAERACSFYDYRPMGERLAADIRSLASSYARQPQEVHA